MTNVYLYELFDKFSGCFVCFLCNEKYPNERDIQIHLHVHGEMNYTRKVFKLRPISHDEHFQKSFNHHKRSSIDSSNVLNSLLKLKSTSYDGDESPTSNYNMFCASSGGAIVSPNTQFLFESVKMFSSCKKLSCSESSDLSSSCSKLSSPESSDEVLSSCNKLASECSDEFLSSFNQSSSDVMLTSKNRTFHSEYIDDMCDFRLNQFSRKSCSSISISPSLNNQSYLESNNSMETSYNVDTALEHDSIITLCNKTSPECSDDNLSFHKEFLKSNNAMHSSRYVESNNATLLSDEKLIFKSKINFSPLSSIDCIKLVVTSLVDNVSKNEKLVPTSSEIGNKKEHSIASETEIIKTVDSLVGYLINNVNPNIANSPSVLKRRLSTDDIRDCKRRCFQINTESCREISRTNFQKQNFPLANSGAERLVFA